MRRLRRKEEKRNKAYNSVHPQGKIWKTLECFAFVRFISTDGVGYCILKSIKLSNWDTLLKIRFIFIFHLSFFVNSETQFPCQSLRQVSARVPTENYQLIGQGTWIWLYFLRKYFQIVLAMELLKSMLDLSNRKPNNHILGL